MFYSVQHETNFSYWKDGVIIILHFEKCLEKKTLCQLSTVNCVPVHKTVVFLEFLEGSDECLLNEDEGETATKLFSRWLRICQRLLRVDKDIFFMNENVPVQRENQ